MKRLILSLMVWCGCGFGQEGDLQTGVRQDAVCTPAWNPTWQQATANTWWVEYTITGGTVTSAYLERPGGARVTLTNQWGKWIGPTSFIARGTQVVVHATNSLNQTAQTFAFGYLVNTAPQTDPCGGTACVPSCSGKQCGPDGCGASCGTCAQGQTCSNDQCVAMPGCNPAWLPPPTWQRANANNWWVEYTITGGTVSSAELQVLGSNRIVTLAFRWNKWGGPTSFIATGAPVVVRATNSLGQSAQTLPFAYLVNNTPQTDPCAGSPPPPACGPSNCTGCCNANGGCLIGDSSAACGTGGAACVDCGLISCVSHACVQLCTPALCPGCCQRDFCSPGTTPFFCGANANACVGCAAGFDCVSAACVPSACTPANCPNGCCDEAGVCQPGTAHTACGSGGNHCSDCLSGDFVCIGQLCRF